MADIVFDYEKMSAAVGEIASLADQYKAAGQKLLEDFQSATAGWEGTSKDAMLRFMTDGVTQYTAETVPQLLKGLSELLDANIKQMQGADQQIAENIPSSLG